MFKSLRRAWSEGPALTETIQMGSAFYLHAIAHLFSRQVEVFQQALAGAWLHTIMLPEGSGGFLTTLAHSDREGTSYARQLAIEELTSVVLRVAEIELGHPVHERDDLEHRLANVRLSQLGAVAMLHQHQHWDGAMMLTVRAWWLTYAPVRGTVGGWYLNDDRRERLYKPAFERSQAAQRMFQLAKDVKEAAEEAASHNE